jgi:hypothetical protein
MDKFLSFLKKRWIVIILIIGIPLAIPLAIILINRFGEYGIAYLLACILFAVTGMNN